MAVIGWRAPARIAGYAVVSFCVVSAPLAAPASTQAWPSKVDARYQISFGGIDVGKFDFKSQVEGQTYTLAGQAEISVVFGAFKWQGTTRSSGGVTGESPRPAAYTLDYRANSKAGSVRMAFNGDAVSNVSMVPPSSPHKETVPVQEQHLKQVLDPLTAIMAMTRGGMAKPCGRKISVFDGKQRFDLQLSFRRQERIAEKRPSGQPGIVFVCRVRYIPVAGHRDNDETQHMARSSAIEVAFRPVPSANLLIPYQITIPTLAGSAVMTSKKVEIATPGREPIALIY